MIHFIWQYTFFARESQIAADLPDIVGCVVANRTFTVHVAIGEQDIEYKLAELAMASDLSATIREPLDEPDVRLYVGAEEICPPGYVAWWALQAPMAPLRASFRPPNLLVRVRYRVFRVLANHASLFALLTDWFGFGNDPPTVVDRLGAQVDLSVEPGRFAGGGQLLDVEWRSRCIHQVLKIRAGGRVSREPFDGCVPMCDWGTVVGNSTAPFGDWAASVCNGSIHGCDDCVPMCD
jgi:hypothetical protein